MAATTLSFSLPPVPSTFDKSAPGSLKGSLPEPKRKDLELLGPKFQAFVRRRFHNRTHSEDEKIQKDIYGSGEVEEEDFSDDEEESAELTKLDPRDWKTQDHYQVLGLSKYRYKATDKQIKAAFHKKVLRHHPDKKAAAGNTNDDAFFKCIQKAHEILTDPIKRRQFDSVDEFYSNEFPTAKTKGDFFKLWTPVFEREARFSKKQPVPGLGGPDASRREVESFYEFWYGIDSWRTFEYLDKEDTDSDSRDHKRYLDKKNKADRAQRKKEENARFMRLIDTAASLDPRIIKFKADDKAQRLAKKAASAKPTPAAAPNAKPAAKGGRKVDEATNKKGAAGKAAPAAAANSAPAPSKTAVRKQKQNVRDIVIRAIGKDEAQLAKLDALMETMGTDMTKLGDLGNRMKEAAAAKNVVEALAKEA